MVRNSMKASKKCRDFISSPPIEGKVLHAYKDTGGIWTIGCGHIKGVKEGDTCTEEQCDAWLAEDISDAEHTVNSLVTVALSQNQFDALVSFVYNIGSHNFQHSTLLKCLNAGNYSSAHNQFAAWVYDEGKLQNGLVHRRKLEAEMFAS